MVKLVDSWCLSNPNSYFIYDSNISFDFSIIRKNLKKSKLAPTEFFPFSPILRFFFFSIWLALTVTLKLSIIECKKFVFDCFEAVQSVKTPPRGAKYVFVGFFGLRFKCWTIVYNLLSSFFFIPLFFLILKLVQLILNFKSLKCQ